MVPGSGSRGMVAKFHNILVVRLSAIGDVVNCLPALRLLKREHPEAAITWAAEQPSASLLEGDPDIDEVFVVKRKEWTRGVLKSANLASLGSAFSALRKKKFDIAIDFQGNLRSGVVTFGSGARVRVGFTAGRVKEHSHVFYTKHVFLPKTVMHRVRKNLLLLGALGIEPEVLPAELQVHAGDGRVTERFLKEKQIEDLQVITVHPGVSKFGAFKQWAPERFAQVAGKLAGAKGRAVVITWGPGERALAEEVVELTEGAALLGPEPHGLRELAYLLKQSVLFVGCDTGPLHIAAAVGTPVVAIFGPKDPGIYGPAGEGHVVVRKQVECSPCERRACPDRRCMRLITADEVYNACLSVLG